LREGDSLLAVEHEMGNLPLHFEGWAEDDISLAEGWSEVFHQLKRQKGIVRISFPYFEQGGGSSLFCRLEEICPFVLGVGATHSSSDEMRT